MSRKNFKVATAENGKTTIIDMQKDKTPTGKVKTKKSAEERRKAREEQYVIFRVNALKRRAKRMGLTEEQTNVKVEELKKQINSTTMYNILIIFNPKDKDMIKQMLMNDSIAYKILSTNYGYIEGDADLLKDLRELLPAGVKIHPYTIKKPPILPTPAPAAKKRKPATKAEKKAAAKKARKSRKDANIAAHLNHKEHAAQRKKEANKKMRKIQKAHKLFQKRCHGASKKGGGTTVQLDAKKASDATKKASTTLKKAA